MTNINSNVLGLATLDGVSPWKLFKLNENSFVVDLGAYAGEFSKYILDTYNCRVDGYEPANICFLEHPKFRLLRKPVWNGEKVKFIDKYRRANSIINNEGIETDTIDIKDITKEKIDLMKVNIEGAEIEVLQRADLNNVEQLLVEFHLSNRLTPPITQEILDKVIKKILSYNYKFIKFGKAPNYFFYK